MPRPLLIGVGALDAGDDAAGRLVAQRLLGPACGFDIVETGGSSADIVMMFEGRDHVLIVDACRADAPPGTIHRIDAAQGPLLAGLSSVSSHGVGVAEGIRLARPLRLLPGRCEVWAIEGADFSFGAPLTSSVAKAVDICVRTIPELLCPRIR